MPTLTKEQIIELIHQDTNEIAQFYLDLEFLGEFDNDAEIWEAVQEEFIEAGQVNPDPNYSVEWIWDMALELAAAKVNEMKLARPEVYALNEDN